MTERLVDGPRVHELKCWPCFYEMMVLDLKHFEYRKNDRDFRAGDHLLLREWHSDSEKYTGRESMYRVDLVVTECPGLPEGYCIMEVTLLRNTVVA